LPVSSRWTLAFSPSNTTTAGWRPIGFRFRYRYPLPLAAKRHTGAVVANYLWNLLPDNDRTLQAWGQIYGVSPNSALALLSKVGEDCAGAVQIVLDQWMADDADSASPTR
jgi:hypothetical protein